MKFVKIISGHEEMLEIRMDRCYISVYLFGLFKLILFIFNIDYYINLHWQNSDQMGGFEQHK